MSEPIDKEGALSTFVSATSAWTALGLGIGLLTLTLFAVLLLAARVAPEDMASSRFGDRLSADLVALMPNTLKISKDGSSLELSRFTKQGKPDRVVYSLDNEKHQLVRKSELDGTTPLGRCEKVRFRRQGASVNVVSSFREREFRAGWALLRWGRGR